MSSTDNVLIVGGGRGLGGALVGEYQSRGASVTATVRNLANRKELTSSHGTVAWHELDVRRWADFASVAGALEGRSFATIIFTVGINVDPDRDRAQSGGQLDELGVEAVNAVWETNAVGALLAAQYFAPLLTPSSESSESTPVFAFISSQRGSLAGVDSGGSFAYAVSKAAMNMMVRKFAHFLEAAEAIVVAVHPGWVRTDMGGPAAPLEPGKSAGAIASLLDGLTAEDSGGFFEIPAERLPW